MLGASQRRSGRTSRGRISCAELPGGSSKKRRERRGGVGQREWEWARKGQGVRLLGGLMFCAELCTGAGAVSSSYGVDILEASMWPRNWVPSSCDQVLVGAVW
jgi:hypothetical protein